MVDITRRRFLGTAAAGVIASSTPGLAAGPADRPAHGCCLCACAAGRLRFEEQDPRGSTRQITIARSSGDAETDRLLGRALLRLSTIFAVQPGFAFFDDGTSPNAFATSESLLPDGKGTVLMGMHLFGQRMARDQDTGVAVIAICAHEFGHIVQMQNGYAPSLDGLDETARPRELHADFLAGYYLAMRRKDHPELDLATVGSVFFGLGDMDFTSVDHHGTPRERIFAIRSGFEFGRSGANAIDAAADAGLATVRGMIRKG